MPFQGRLIIEGGVLMVGDGRLLEGATLVIEQRLISELREDGSLPTPRPSDRRIKVDGRLVTPGFVDSWLNLPLVAEQAASVLAEALMTGSTSVLALAHPSIVEDIAGFVERLGIRMVLAVDVSGLSPDEARDSIEGLSRQIRGRGVALTPGLFLGSLSACSVDFAQRVPEFVELAGRGPLLVSGACNESGLARLYERFECRPIECWHRFGALGPNTVVGEANLLSTTELELLAKSDCWCVASPRSAWSEGLLPPIEKIQQRGAKVALGSSNAGPSVIRELECLRLVDRGRRTNTPESIHRSFFAGASLMNSFLDVPMGGLASGFLADVAIHRVRPSVLYEGLDWSRSLEGLTGVDWAIVGGRVVLSEGRLQGVDIGSLARLSRRKAHLVDNAAGL